VLIFKERVTINFDRYRLLCKNVAISEGHVNMSWKQERGVQLTCGLISCGFEILVLFIFAILWACFYSEWKFLYYICLKYIMYFMVLNSVVSVISFLSTETVEFLC